MRDIVWTIIVIWVVWKIYNLFKNVSHKKTQSIYKNNNHQQNNGEIKIEQSGKLKSHFNPNDGEYVDYEEIKWLRKSHTYISVL